MGRSGGRCIFILGCREGIDVAGSMQLGGKIKNWRLTSIGAIGWIDGNNGVSGHCKKDNRNNQT